MFPPFVRQPDGTYDVLAGSGKHYYEVQMLGAHAVSCQCDRFRRGKQACKHMERAEQEEAKFQVEQKGFHLDAPLTNASFSFLKV